MRILLDTHVLLWALSEPQRLSADARSMIEAPENAVFFSAASIWEIAIKAHVKRAGFSFQPEEVAHAATESGFVELPIRAATAAHVSRLPLHHRDPFDRLIVAQAMFEPAHLLTVDPILRQYSELVTIV
jgi:PIN domain nuclease of toxin-antitoxin system